MCRRRKRKMLSETYSVDRILARRPIGPKTAKFEYLVAWRGYGTAGDTREHESFFDECHEHCPERFIPEKLLE